MVGCLYRKYLSEFVCTPFIYLRLITKLLSRSSCSHNWCTVKPFIVYRLVYKLVKVHLKIFLYISNYRSVYVFLKVLSC